MNRLLAILVLALVSLVVGATAQAAVIQYGNDGYWGAGEGKGSAFSSSWFQNTMYKSAPFDSTITFIDNVSYTWVNTRRSTAGYMQTHWLSSQVKKAHCRSNVVAPFWAGCSVYS